MSVNHDERLVFFDLETGGLFDVVAGRVKLTKPITQIAAIAVDRYYNECETFEIKIRFDEQQAEPVALAANHYDRKTWQRDAFEPEEAAKRFANFLRRHATIDCISKAGRPYRIAQLVAHNAERFDGPLIHAWFKLLDQYCPAAYSVFCTKQKAFWLFHECQTMTPIANYKLITLCEYFGVQLRKEDAHDALNDVRAMAQLYRAMLAHQASYSPASKVDFSQFRKVDATTHGSLKPAA